MSRFGILWTAIGLLAAGSAPAEDPVASLLAANRAALTVRDGRLEGPGGELLISEAEAAEMFLVGELHWTRETPQLTTALIHAIGPRGYGVLAVEVGPISAERLTALASRADGVAAVASLVKRLPFSVPIFDWRDEAEMLVAALRSDFEICGLDQEFLGSPRMHLERLAELAASAPARAEVAAWQAAETAAIMRFLEVGSGDDALPSDAVLMSKAADDFRRLRALFPGNAEAERIINELAESAVIYQLSHAGKRYENNHQRVKLMKRHLHQQLGQRTPGAPHMGKILMKFGAVHMERGYSPSNQLDLGNHVAELAAAHSGDSFHLEVMARELAGAENEDRADGGPEAPYLARLHEQRASDDWTVFDLRALRPYFHRPANREGHEKLSEIVWRYDAIAYRPQFRPAEPLPGAWRRGG